MESEKEGAVKLSGLSLSERQKFLEAFKTMQAFLYRINDAAGWHDPAPTDAECVANVHGEVSELNEWLRQGCSDGRAVNMQVESDHINGFSGVEEEGADIIIRLMNWFKRKEWRLAEALLAKAEYNATRPRRHGGKSF